MVFQNFALFPHLSVDENIAFGLTARNMPPHVIENEVAMVCLKMNLTGLEKRYPGELSGGQQQRVALARAVINKPDILLFDEPLSNLDQKLRAQMRTEIKRLQQQMGMTVLYVTHDQTEAMSISDTIVVMKRGEIIQKGSPQEVYNHPETPFVSDFIGRANFLVGTVLFRKKTEYRILCAGIELILPVEICEESLSPGERVLLALKPETIRIDPFKGMLKGRVEICSFQGAITEYKILHQEGTLSVLQSNIDKKAALYPRGSDVFLDFTSDQINLYTFSSF